MFLLELTIYHNNDNVEKPLVIKKEGEDILSLKDTVLGTILDNCKCFNINGEITVVMLITEGNNYIDSDEDTFWVKEPYEYLYTNVEDFNKEEVVLKVKYLNDTYDEENALQFIEGKSDWIDLRASEDVEIEEGKFAMIPLGVAMQIPKGYEAHIVSRSSTYKNWGIIQTNSFGVIDESYCGDNDQWHFPAYCLRADTIRNGRRITHINKGERICQFRLMKHQPKMNIISVESLGNKDRGGFGSTGTK